MDETFWRILKENGVGLKLYDKTPKRADTFRSNQINTR